MVWRSKPENSAEREMENIRGVILEMSRYIVCSFLEGGTEEETVVESRRKAVMSGDRRRVLSAGKHFLQHFPIRLIVVVNRDRVVLWNTLRLCSLRCSFIAWVSRVWTVWFLSLTWSMPRAKLIKKYIHNISVLDFFFPKITIWFIITFFKTIG